MKRFGTFMHSWREQRITDSQKTEQQPSQRIVDNGRALLPSEEEPDMERDRR